MRDIVGAALLGTAVGAMGWIACDAPQPATTATAVPAASGAPASPASDARLAEVRAALADAVRDRDPYSGARKLGTLLPTLGAESVPAIVSTLEDPTLDSRATSLGLLVRFWATYDPEAAVLWAMRKVPSDYKIVALYPAISTWAEMNPKAAMDKTWSWAEIPGLERIVPIALMRGWYAANDSEGQRRFLRGVPLDVQGQRAHTAYVRIMIEREGSPAVIAWAESLRAVTDDDKSYKTGVFRRVADALSQFDVPAAVAWCTEQCAGPYGKDMRSLISRNWVLSDGPAAMRWLSTAHPGNERDYAVRLTYALWSRQDREGAKEWMAAAEGAGEPPPWLAPGFAVYAKLLSGEDPVEALQWAGRVENKQEREQVTVGILRVWRVKDEQAVKNWVLQSSLPENAREKVWEPIPGNGDPA